MRPRSKSEAVIIFTAPSGAGKSTLARAVMRNIPSVSFSVSATTRKPREGEVDGEHYHFVSHEEFDEMIRNDELMEYEEVYPGLFYGTPWSEVEKSSADEPVLLDIDVKGAKRVKDAYGTQCYAVFVAPPSVEKLEQRLIERQSESSQSLAARIKRWPEEMTYRDEFDAVIMNDDLERASDESVARVAAWLKDLKLREEKAGG